MSKIRSFDEYKEWWAQEVALERRTMPDPRSMEYRYTNYLNRAPAYLADEVNYARQAFEVLRQVNKKVAHAAMYDNGAVRILEQDYSLVHKDGNPNNNDPFNLIWVSREQIVNQKHIVNHKIGYTMEEAIRMTNKVATVIFASREHLNDASAYEYLVPGDTTITEGTKLYAVVARSVTADGKISGLTVVEVTAIKDVLDAQFEGKLKHVVTLFTAESYLLREQRQQERNRLIKKATQLAEERNTIDKLTKLIGDSEEGKALLAKIAELE